MKIYYSWISGSHTSIVVQKFQKEAKLDDRSIEWLKNFSDVWKSLDAKSIAVIPVENSYAGPVRENMYKFIKHNYFPLAEIHMPINRCLLSKETDISAIEKVYSHQKALSQCEQFLEKYTIEAVPFSGQTRAAKYISEHNKSGRGAIASSLAAEIYGLNIIAENVQDEWTNTTKFFVIGVAPNLIDIPKEFVKHDKTVAIFETHNEPAALYKSLAAFANNDVNLTRIENIQDSGNSAYFRLECSWTPEQANVSKAFREFKSIVKSLRILWE